MNELDVILFSAENNTKFVELLESCLVNLEKEIKEKIPKYTSVFHTTMNSVFSLNLLQENIQISLGEIEYFVDIKRIYTSLHEQKVSSIVGMEEIKKSLLCEMEAIVKNHFSSKDIQ